MTQIEALAPAPTDAEAARPAAGRGPRVFVSYSHESAEHADRVLDLSDRLRRDGIESVLDQYAVSPPEGWPAWMDRQIDACEFVLLVCTETYFRRVMGREEVGKGLGVRWEGTLIYQAVFDSPSGNARFIPVLFEPWTTDYIPRPVKGASRYRVDTAEGYEALYRHLTKQPKSPAPPVAPQLRQWRREPDQANEFARVRRQADVAIQATGDGSAVDPAQPHLTLARWHGRKRPVRSELDLLNPFCRAIPLIGREAETAALQGWLAAPAPIAARCLVGRAGAGKTRLAIELCAWAEAREWRAGFVDPAELVRFHRQQNLGDWSWQTPTLAVIDGAATTARTLRRWLVELAAHPGVGGRPLRLLLLERHADRKLGWWADLVTARNFQEEGLLDLFDPPEPCLLSSIAASDDRRRLLAAGIAAAASLRGREVGAEAEPSVAMNEKRDQERGLAAGVEPLYLLMGAITDGGRPSSAATSRSALASDLARFELGRIASVGLDRQLKGEFLAYMAGFATLAGGLPLNRVIDVIAAEQKALHWEGAGDPPELAEALGDALAEVRSDGERAVPPVLPELVGEAVILTALRKMTPEAQAAVVGRARAVAGRKCIATVVRTAQDFADGQDHPSLLWLDALLEAAGDPAELRAISDQLPERTVCMIERAVAVESRLAQAQRALVEADPGEAARRCLARCLARQASRLRDVCRLEDALAVADEAVAIHRSLRASEGEVRPAEDFAEALVSLGGIARDLGLREEALAASAEAVTLLRASPQAPARRSLALALSVSSCHLSDLGRREDALAAAEEAVGLHRALASAQPDTEAPPLALALLNLAFCRSDVGRETDALAAAEESAMCLRSLARSKPDAFLPAYAQALDNVAIYLARLERPAEALDRAREAVALQRILSEGCPEAYRSDLALMLNGYANALRRTGDLPAALSALDEAVDLLRGLAAARPQAHRADLAKQLNNQSILLAASSETKRALEAGREAVHILRELAAARPDRHDEDLATAFACLAFCHREAGDSPTMLNCAMQSVALRRRLAGRWPEAFHLRLGRSLLVLTEALKLCGREAEAEATAAEAAMVLAE